MFSFLKKKHDAPAADTLRPEELQRSASQIQFQYLMLQSQINPHFLYNTLDSIRSEALKNDQTVIAEMVERLSKFFRYCISNHDSLVSLAEELHHVDDYFYIQRFRSF